ncbi:hypothetical protein [Burkholderia sp. Bp8963]|uniref:hypothetical protein n=1 Tax=Burkholderia sp. Bp8963 TaxID=2184547 RepID=UPI000F5A0B2B|nr:hypothetical protein [Burkholderia sp. Bp8963]
MALDAYEEARLLWLSCEAVLRSATIVDVPPPHAGKNIVICGGNAHVRESIALLLRLRGFRTTVISKSRIDEAISHGPAVAVVVDIERDPDHACMLAVNTLEIYPGTRVVGMIPATLEHYDWKGFDVILVKPVSTDRIVQVVTGESRP